MASTRKKRGKLYMANEHFVYILQCKDDTLYTGYTTNIVHRLKMHEKGKGAKYTRGRGPFSVVYQETLSSKEAALRREYEIKQLQRLEKLDLIKSQKG